MRKILTKLEKKRVKDYEAIVKREIDALDPIGLFPNAPDDEYKNEIRSISLRVDEVWSKDIGYYILKLAEIMYIVFSYQFDITEAGNVAKYVNTAGNIIKEIEKKRTDAISDMEKKYPMLYRRHKRIVMAYPEGGVVHDGDCAIYQSSIGICTCGLHHELLLINHDDVMQIYPKYYDEQDGKILAEVLLRIKGEGGLFMKCRECKGSGVVPVHDCPVCDGKGFVPFKMPEPISDEKAKEILEGIFNKSGDKAIGMIIDELFNKNKDNSDIDDDYDKLK